MDKPTEAVRAALEMFAEDATRQPELPTQPTPAPAFDFSVYTDTKPPTP